MESDDGRVEKDLRDSIDGLAELESSAGISVDGLIQVGGSFMGSCDADDLALVTASSFICPFCNSLMSSDL